MQMFHAARGRSIGWNRGLRASLTTGLIMGISQIASSTLALTITSCVNNKNGAVSIISKGSCPNNTHAVVLNPISVQALTVQTLNVVDSSNHTVATLGKGADGNLLTFFDSNGKRTLTLGNDATETFAGLETYDGNNIAAGDGVARTEFGEASGTDPLMANQDSPKSQYFGGQEFDGSGNTRAFWDLVLDSSDNNSVFNAPYPNGSQIEFATAAPQNLAGIHIADLNGAIRQVAGVTLDGTMNSYSENDASGFTRVYSQQAPDNSGGFFDGGNFFALLDPNEFLQSRMGATDDGSETGFDLLDPDGILRFRADLQPAVAGAQIVTSDGNGNQTGILGGACLPLTCEDEHINCGLASDGCGNKIACGTCPTGQTCGGGATANVCG